MRRTKWLGFAAIILISLAPPGWAGAILFDQTTDTISVAGTSIPIATSSTYEARVFFSDTFQGYGIIFDKWTNALEEKTLRAGPRSFSQIYGLNYPINSPSALAPTVSLTLNAWHHIAYVYDGSQERIYLDGLLVASRAASGDVGDSNGPAFVGALMRGSQAPSFIGYLDTLRLSNVSRYSGSSFTPPAGDLTTDANTLLLYNFNESPGSPTVADLSGNGHTGTLGAGNFAGATSPAFVSDPAGTPPVVSSICGPSSPAPISGSTGEQGVLDPTNTNASLGVVWPANAIGAGIALDTGAVDFIDSTGAELPNTATLPGVSGYPAFPDGKLNFTSVHLPPGKVVLIFCCDNELLPSLEIAPAMILSCQDVIVEGNGDGTLANNGGILAVVGRFDGGGRGNPPVSNPAGFGPRSVPRPATGTLFPAVPAGGGRGGTGIPVGQTVSQTLRGGDGGGAAVIAAAGRITVNGLVSVNPNILWTLPNLPDPGETPPLNAQAASSSSTVAQGGAGGSVRFAAVLVEGIGKIDTSGGLDSDGGKTSLDGPIEIQAFLQDLFTGTASTTPIRGNPVVAPIPDNLPTIQVVGVTVSGSDFCGFECPNTGSLSTPDVTLPPTSSPVTVFVEASTTGVPNGTSLTFRAVGTNGAVSAAIVAVGGPECPIPGPSIACADLTLNPGATYQMVVYPSTAFALANLGTPPTPMSNKPVYAGLQIVPNEQKTEARSQKLEVRSQTKVAAKPVAEKPLGTRDLSPLEQWARAFGVDPEAHQKMAQLKTAP